MRHPPGRVGGRRRTLGVRRAALARVRHPDPGAEAPVPETLPDLKELALEREPDEKQPVGEDGQRERPAALDRRPAHQPVDQLAGAAELSGDPPYPLPRVHDAGRVEDALPRRVLGAVVVDPHRERVGEHRLGAPVQLGRQPLQPVDTPDVVVTGPGEVHRAGVPLTRELERSAPVTDEP
jgi:hypothetical protein